jgi:tight adherence protein B
VSRHRGARRRFARLTDVPASRGRWRFAALAAFRPMVVTTAGAAVAAVAAGAVGGVVAAAIAGWYALLGMRALRRVAAERSVTATRTATLDALGGLAADLRAGAPAPAAVDAVRAMFATGTGVSAGTGVSSVAGFAPAGAPDAAQQRAAWRLAAACEVSERLGAPLADLLDRVESDLRNAERVRAAVAAQTSGARASAALLALLPVAGVGLGYAMGARPGQALLHTPLGAACALGALLLQSAGLGWTDRLCRTAVGRAT